MATTNFTPTPAEFALVNQIFAQADTQKTGILTGDVAVKVFSGSKLPSTVLGEIWSIADGKNDGFLTKKGVAIALRLMGHAQKGDKVHKSLLSKPAPLAVIEGIHAPVVQQSTGMSIPNSPPLTPGLPPLTPQDRAKFNRLFQSCGPVDGLLSGDKARNMFIKSKLPVDVLSQIWSLCDTHERGALDSVDFTVAMYLIQLTMSGKLSFVPTTLPPGLYEQASGSLTAQVTGGSAHLGTPASSTFPFPPTKQSPVHPQFTGQGAHNIPPALPSRRPGPAAQAPMIPPFPSATAQASVPWDVTPAEKASSDQFFDTLDTHKRGYIEGDVAVPFMLLSKLPEDVLAQVWDISDINNDGRLTRDGFAVALHLIQGKLAGKDIPNTLPPTLVPPSMRKTISPFTTAASSRSSEPTRDLLWDEPSPTSNLYHQPQLTGAQAPARIYAPPAASQAPQDPFGTSFSDSSFNKDLLGDDDDTPTSPPFHDQSAEIGNAQNQLNSTNKSLQTAKSERENLETTLASQAAQLSALQTQLATAKASFETETTLLNSLRERHATQTADIQKVREELIRSESDLSAVRVEKAELEGSFLRDKEEVRELNKKMLEITNQIATTKQEVEKVKKEAKQQKGLLAIARKQFATKESEKTRVDKELEEARTDLVNVTKEREEEEVGSAVPSLAETIERAKSPADSLAFAAAQPLPLTPDLTGATSPTSAKSNNPFGKLVKSVESSTPRSQSPFRPFSAVPAPSSSPPPTNLPLSPETNPFGLRRASDAKPQEIFQETLDNHVTDGTTTPRIRTSTDFNTLFGTNDEQFSTPVSDTPVNQDNDAARVHMFEAAVTHFPALEEMAEELPAASEKHTDLSVALHDLDVEESDSDSDGDDDTNGKAPHEETQAFKPFSPTKETSSEPVQIFFEGAFGGAGQSMEGPIVPEPSSTQEAEISSPAVDPFGVLMKSAETHQNSLSSSAKEAGNMTFTDPPQTSSSFFDDTFGENFDFGSQSTPEKIPIVESPSTTAAPVNGNIPKDKAPASHSNGGFDLFFQPMSTSTSAAPKEEPQPTAAHISFDSGSGAWNTSQTQSEQTDPNQSGLAGITFDEAFGGLDSSQALRLGDSLSSRSSKVIMSPAPDSGTAFPATSPPTSPHGPSRIASGRPTSPHARATSPPPRVASPKTLRSSTSSSRDVHEKPAPPPRHSKLSLRLPFVKKKKHDQAPPLPPSSLSRRAKPIREQNRPPGIEDDDESVKQLSAMGFSRDQAVAALEANDYDMQRTLNSLLGAQ